MKISPSAENRPREAILLVAGTGSRLRPLTNDCPKCLIEVGDISLLQRLLHQLQEVGIERVVLATGYLHDKLVSTVDTWDLSIDVVAIANDTFATENNAVSLATAMEGLTSERFLLCDGDILLHRSQPLDQLLDVPHDNVLTMMRFDAMGQEEMKITLTGDDSKIAELGKGLEPTTAAGESLGMQKIGPSAFAKLSARLDTLNATERVELYYEDVFAELIGDGVDFYACDLEPGGWTEIDTPADLEAAHQMAAKW